MYARLDKAQKAWQRMPAETKGRDLAAKLAAALRGRAFRRACFQLACFLLCRRSAVAALRPRRYEKISCVVVGLPQPVPSEAGTASSGCNAASAQRVSRGRPFRGSIDRLPSPPWLAPFSRSLSTGALLPKRTRGVSARATARTCRRRHAASRKRARREGAVRGGGGCRRRRRCGVRLRAGARKSGKQRTHAVECSWSAAVGGWHRQSGQWRGGGQWRVVVAWKAEPSTGRVHGGDVCKQCGRGDAGGRHGRQGERAPARQRSARGGRLRPGHRPRARSRGGSWKRM